MFRALKKRLLERQCRGLLEFIEPQWTLDTVVGHEAAKARLREDAALLKRGALDSLPMGYLLCGPVGTGKSFLAQCVSGEIGVPCVMLKNFRSKYVGETEGNLERVLSVLRAMGPVVVVVDEADAALGSREQEGDSGTSSRVFGDDRHADGRHRSIAAASSGCCSRRVPICCRSISSGRAAPKCTSRCSTRPTRARSARCS